jgi:Cu(I)/Ag(I) efflux system membrane fusion protein/cobalt-zinc-cadmium efflux system membrane fusion protein
MAGGIVLTLLLVADPLHIHPIDEMLHRALNHAQETGGAAEGEKQLWTCGMHPEVISEEPGTCPICGMNLVRLAGGAPAAASLAPSGERKIAFYRHPHNPTVTSPTPKKDEMGMDFVPVYAEGSSGGSAVTIDNATIQNMNVKTAPAELRSIGERIRTVGYLEYDEERMVTVTTKYSGFVEKVFVNYVGEPVRRGEALFEIYSPELVQTQQELLSAIEFAARMAGAGDDAKRQAEGLVRAARERLAYWDISPAQVARLENSGKVIRTLKVTSPANGLVMKRMSGLEGMAVRPGMELFHIADLSSLWLKAELFEDQLARVPLGSPANVTLTYFPGETFRGKVRFIEPQVSEKTRTVALKVEVPNRGGRLRAGMYATVLFDRADAAPVVAVPSLAVLRTGQRNVVIVAEGGGRFSPREVQLGAEGNGWVEIRAGVAAGEEIVTSSQFLIDSESNLREAVQKLISSRQRKVGTTEGRKGGGDA